MAPTAISLPPAPSTHPLKQSFVLPPSTAVVSDGPALVIGSLLTAQDGKYQSAVNALVAEGGRGVDRVEKQLLDRIVDEATTLTPSRFSVIYLILSPSDYDSLKPKFSTLLSFLLPSLIPSGTLRLANLTSDAFYTFSSQLSIAGLTLLSNSVTEGTLFFQKPAQAKPVSVSLPRRSTNNSAKKALWALSSPSTPTIDPSSLLTPSDLARPVPTCEPVNAGAPRRKKACKNCSCGLAELEQEELKNQKVVLLDLVSEQNDSVVEVAAGQEERGRLAKAAAAASKATSSCGSCFLGDAFRCASCPYMGLPAFEPGQKVEIDFGMDDI